MTDEEYIHSYREHDIRSLALKKVPEGVNALWCLQQIEGYQLAKKKLPSWANTEGIWYPPRLSMEQCSSEATACYKKAIIERLGATSLTDLTGGFGVDFSYMAQVVPNSTYIEQQKHLCDIAQHNLPRFGLQAQIINAECEDYLTIHTTKTENSVIFIDPARRDGNGYKVFAIEDCTPDIGALQGKLLKIADYVLIKLSPMLDITQALRSLKNVSEVHVISVKGECKELLLLQSNYAKETTFFCANLDTAEDILISKKENMPAAILPISNYQDIIGKYLFEPNASILKAGTTDAFATRYGLQKLHQVSNLFIGSERLENCPARQFKIIGITDFSKQNLKVFLKETKQANITIRNFPSTVAELRKRLKLKDGGDTYLFATTLSDGKHYIIKGKK